MNTPVLLVIGGPTGSGKTDLSIRLAKQIGCSIVSADSRQVFAEMPIGSAAPDADQLAEVKHYLVGSKSINEPFNAGLFEKEVMDLLPSLFEEHPIQIVCGGTGLYIDALINGLDELPTASEEVRDALRQQFQQSGIHALQEELKKADPVYASQVDLNNPQRIIRALEVIRSSGQRYSDLRQKKAIYRPFKVIYLATDLPREELYRNINQRTQSMLNKGWLKEAEQLLPYRHLNALQTVGYKELFQFFDGTVSLEQAVDLIRQNTRRYAKRQVTWLRNKATITWVNPLEDADTLIKKFL
jgi:tRNA dimethylallyltransferase